MSISVKENNLFYITCFKGTRSITAKKETCLWNILSITESYVGLDWMCGLFQDNYVVEDCRSGCCGFAQSGLELCIVVMKTRLI